MSSAYFKCPQCQAQIPVVIFDEHRREHLENPFIGYFPETLAELQKMQREYVVKESKAFFISRPD